MKKNAIKILYLNLILIIMISCNRNKKSIDMLISNATVYTVDSNFSIVNCIAIDKGKIIETGETIDIINKYNADTIIDIKEKFVYPGFNDAHCHFYSYSIISEYWINLRNTKSFEEMLKRVVDFKEGRNYDWIAGRGWDQNNWEKKEFPCKDTLDKLFPDNPVVLVRIDGHAVLANNEALKRANITIDTKFEGGEVFVKDDKLTGILLDKAADYMKEQVPAPNTNEIIQCFINSEQNCFAAGLTSITEAGLEKDIILLYDSLQKNNKLKIRINAMIHPSDENIEHFVENGIYKTERLNVRSIKLYADGALGSRGARLFKPYSDDTSNYGLIVEPIDKYHKICKKALESGYQICTHAIGDSANRMILNIYGKYLLKQNDKRWRIEHAQVIHPDDVKLFKEFSIIPSIQATHATSDMYWVEARLGKERTKNAYIYKTLLEQNGWLPNGTDFPIEEIFPLNTFYAAVVRKDSKAYPENGFNSENALDRISALRSITIWAAKAAFEENEKGSLETGKFADIVILDKDIMNIDENEILNTKVLMTISGGEIVWKNNE